MMIRVVELFAGVGSQSEALNELGIEYEVVAISEIDKYAVAGYESIHGNVNNLGDITKIEHLPECDLITYSFPCQDISHAGCRAGFKEESGTRSALLWEVGRLLDDMKERNCLPDILLMENVDAILNQINYAGFVRWMTKLSEMGYTSSYDIMNAKDYGTPQIRKRCFMVSTLTKGEFIFPKSCPNDTVLEDLLERDVNGRYYLSEEKVPRFKKERFAIEYGRSKILSPRRTEFGKKVRKDFDRGFTDYSRNDMTELEPREDGVSNTITTAKKDNILMEATIKDEVHLRYLTPRECFRLQAFPEDKIDRILDAVSESQGYKIAGNSIAICCLKAIFKGIYIDNAFKKGTRQFSLGRWLE